MKIAPDVARSDQPGLLVAMYAIKDMTWANGLYILFVSTVTSARGSGRDCTAQPAVMSDNFDSPRQQRIKNS